MAKPLTEQAGSVFAFLRALQELRNRPIATLQGYSSQSDHWVHHMDETPRMIPGIEFWGSVGVTAFRALNGDVTAVVQAAMTAVHELQPSVLRIPKPSTPSAPEPPAELGPWLATDFEDEREAQSLSDYITIQGSNEDEPERREALIDHPEIQDLFLDWMIRWEAWVAAVAKQADLRRLYENAFQAREVLKGHPEDWELVLGIGRLRVPGAIEPLDRHLFTVHCVFDLDSTTGTLFVRRDEVASFRVEDEWIQGIPKPDRERLEALCEELNRVPGTDFETTIESFVGLAHDYRSTLKTDHDSPRPSEESLLLAPSLILRKRGRRELIELLDAIEKQLDHGASVPEPLHALLEPGFGERNSTERWSSDGGVVSIDDSLYTPLPLNRMQTRALEHADTRNATLIQGPPGTGKTRTIAVMVSHFLARGQRVLVVAETSQALKEVRGQIPEELRDLAVAKLGGGRSDKDDLQKAVNALNEAYEQRHDLYDRFSEHEARLMEDLDRLHRERAGEIRKILDIRSREATSVSIEGFEGTPARLTLAWLDQRAHFDWIDAITVPNGPGPALSPASIAQIKSLLRQAWDLPEQVSSDNLLPDVDSLISVEDFMDLVRLSASQADDRVTEYVPDSADELLDATTRLMREFDSLQTPEAEWMQAALREGMEGNPGGATALLRLVREHLTVIDELSPRLTELRNISCPKTQVTLKPVLRALRDHVAKKGELKTAVTGELKVPLLGGSTLKVAAEQFRDVRISGKAPSTVEELMAIEAVVDFDELLSNFVRESGVLESSVPQDRQAQLLWLQRQLANVQVAEAALANLANLRTDLQRSLRPGKRLSSPLNLSDVVSSLQDTLDATRLAHLQVRVRTHKAALAALPQEGSGSVERAYLEALSGDDVQRFAAAHGRMKSLCSAAASMRAISKELIDCVPGDSVFLKVLHAWSAEKPDIDRRQFIEHQLDEMPDALRWKRLGLALGKTDRSDYSPHFRAVQRLDGALAEGVRELARRRAWKKALDRIDASTISSMQRYALEQRKYGAGTGKRAPQRRREIRKYLEKCIPAIPAWIMPISEVARTFPREIANFDVVIVDEASQAPLSSLFLLALAKRAVIVGDHKQVSPEDIGLKIDQVEEIANRHLKGMEQRANWTNLGISLFDECKSAFAHMITLTEHHRCVPEIIGFSNEIAYEPEHIRLIPVRQTGTDALPPVELVFVPDGYVRGEGASVTNPPEADAIAARIEEIIADPRYRDMTIGVITLQGTAQAEVIRKRVTDRIDAAEYERRRLQFGNAPAFQGAERHVMLLSMVAAPGARHVARTTETDVQRYNVAVSRAKDQLIVFHSIRTNELNNPNDLRRRLLEYCERQLDGLARRVEGAVGLVSETERQAPFDSLFEQRVHNRIVARGYTVIPQYRPEIEGHDYRIDLVVVGRHGKLAVECDGDFFHGGIEQFRQDQIRQDILVSGGWRFFRIPESEFYSNPEALDELWPLLEELGAEEWAPELAVPDDDAEEEFPSVVSSVAEEGPDEPGTDYSDFESGAETSDTDVQMHDGGLAHRIAQMTIANARPVVAEPREGAGSSLAPEAGLVDTDSRLFLPGVAVRTFPRPEAPQLRWLEPYHRWGLMEGRRTVSIATGSEAIWRDLLEIVTVEGPVLGGFLSRRHYKASGGSSLSSSNEASYLGHLRALVRRGELVAEDQDVDGTLATATFRLPDQPPVRTRVRGDRLLYDMPPRELAAIVRGTQLAHRGLDISRNEEEVFRRVLDLLDFTKLTRKAYDHLARIVAAFEDELRA